jgi:RHS repeat-associated protein
MEICTNNKTMTSAQCGYDALGRRIEARSFADGQLDAVRRYWYNDQWQVLTQGLWSQAYAGLALSRNYIYGNTIDEVLGFEWVVDGTPGMRYYYLHDHLYSPAAMLTEWGIVERYEYDAYGRRSVMSAGFAHRSNSHYLSDLGLTGREIDELDLDANDTPRLHHMHYRHRDYSPQLGRFLQHDPLGVNPAGRIENPFYAYLQYVNGNNIYQYVNSQPLNAHDPYGLAIWWDCVACGAALAAKFGGGLGGVMYYCPRDNPNISWGECVNQVFREFISPCELWESFKGNPAEWIGAAACISCGVTIFN